jgi:hypothetical protein
MVATLAKEATAAPQEPKKRTRHRAASAQAARGLSMEKWMCWGAIIAAGLMLLLFILDIVANIPFSGASKWGLDLFGILASCAVIFLAVDTLREFK